ncbi:MAG: SPOR domain-containing protein [Calditrichia bacterium]
MMKIWLNYGLTGILLILLAGCATTPRKEAPPEPEPVEMDESFDPVKLNNEDLNFSYTKKTVEKVNPADMELPEVSEKKMESNQETDGYRIQIISTKELDNATNTKDIAGDQFIDLGVNLYMDFDSPYYKVRLGDFRDRVAAEELLKEVRSRGYPKAWIVKTKVYQNPYLPEVVDSTMMEIPKDN